jgi:hypothetical protein
MEGQGKMIDPNGERWSAKVAIQTWRGLGAARAGQQRTQQLPKAFCGCGGHDRQAGPENLILPHFL